MLREVHRAIEALAGRTGSLPTRPGGGGAATPGAAGASDSQGRAVGGRNGAAAGPPISKARAIVQIVLTIVLVPTCLWALFVAPGLGSTARSAAGALLGAIVTFWLKD